jgi:hypothetical protein
MFFERTLLPSQTDVFLRGDADGDRTLSIVDAIQTLRFLFEREGELLCLKAADSNDDGRLNVVDLWVPKTPSTMMVRVDDWAFQFNTAWPLGDGAAAPLVGKSSRRVGRGRRSTLSVGRTHSRERPRESRSACVSVVESEFPCVQETLYRASSPARRYAVLTGLCRSEATILDSAFSGLPIWLKLEIFPSRGTFAPALSQHRKALSRESGDATVAGSGVVSGSI